MVFRTSCIALEDLALTPLSQLQIVTKSGSSAKIPCSMSPSDFLSIYNKRRRTMTFPTGTGAFCRLNKKEISLITIEPISDSPFKDLEK